MAHLWKLGYAPEDIISNIFRVAKHLEIKEALKLKFIQVNTYIIIETKTISSHTLNFVINFQHKKCIANYIFFINL